MPRFLRMPQRLLRKAHVKIGLVATVLCCLFVGGSEKLLAQAEKQQQERKLVFSVVRDESKLLQFKMPVIAAVWDDGLCYREQPTPGTDPIVGYLDPDTLAWARQQTSELCSTVGKMLYKHVCAPDEKVTSVYLSGDECQEYCSWNLRTTGFGEHPAASDFLEVWLRAQRIESMCVPRSMLDAAITNRELFQGREQPKGQLRRLEPSDSGDK